MELQLRNFKQHKNQKLCLDEHTILYGSNGTGKTSFLEALELFFSNTHTIFRDLILNSDNSEIMKLFEGYLNNQTYMHENMKWKTFSKNRGDFSITFKFTFGGDIFFVEKKYDTKGHVKIDTNLEKIEGILEFFKYKYIYFKKDYNDGPLSKGEYAIDYMLKSIDFIEQDTKSMAKLNIDTQKYLIVAFDEPDNKIHPIYWKEIYSKVLRAKANVIISTTNLFTIENFLEYKNTAVYYFEKKILTQNNLTEIYKIEVKEKIDSEENSEGDRINKVIGKYLDLEYGSLKNILPVKKYVFVEGNSDCKFVRLLLKDMGFKDIEVISLDGQDTVVSEQYLKPILSFITLIQNFSPNVFCIFDYDFEGFKYASYFKKIIPIKNMFFINGEKYIDQLEGWDETDSKFTLENLLYPKFIKEREYIPLKNQKIKEILYKRINSLENNDFKFKGQNEKDEFLIRFQGFLDGYFIPEKDSVAQKVKANKGKSKPLFQVKAGKDVINYGNFRRPKLNTFKTTVKELLGEIERPYELINKKYNPAKTAKIRELKKSLNIPDYVLKVNSKSISFYKGYNYLKFNTMADEGLISPKITELIEILNEDLEYEVEKQLYTLKDLNGDSFEVRGFELKGIIINDKVKSHKALYKLLCKSLYETDNDLLKSCIENNKFNGTKNAHFADSSDKIIHDKYKIDNDLWIETRFNKAAVYNKIKLLLNLYKIPIEDFKINVNM